MKIVLMPKLKRQNRRFSGFTLIELLVVISVIAVLGALFINNSTINLARARDSKRMTDLKQYQNALEVYSLKNNGFYPGMGSNYPVNVSSLCSYFNMTNCPNDPRSVWGSYIWQSGAGGLGVTAGTAGATDYFLAAQLEVKNSSGQSQYFVLCSNGKSGIITSPPSNSAYGQCPNGL